MRNDLHLTRWRSITDWNIAVPIKIYSMAILQLYFMQIWWRIFIRNSEMTTLIFLWRYGKNCHISPKISETTRITRPIFTKFSAMVEIRVKMIKLTFVLPLPKGRCYGNQLILITFCRRWNWPYSLFVLEFRNGMQYCLVNVHPISEYWCLDIIFSVHYIWKKVPQNFACDFNASLFKVKEPGNCLVPPPGRHRCRVYLV